MLTDMLAAIVPMCIALVGAGVVLGVRNHVAGPVRAPPAITEKPCPVTLVAGFAYVHVTEVTDSIHGTSSYRGWVRCGTPDSIPRDDLKNVPLVLSACPEEGTRPSPGVVELMDHLCHKPKWLDILAADERLVKGSNGSSAILLNPDFLLRSIDIGEDGALSVSNRHVDADPLLGREKPTHMKMVAWKAQGPRGEIMFQLLEDYLHVGISLAVLESGELPVPQSRDSIKIPERGLQLNYGYCMEFGWRRNIVVWAEASTTAPPHGGRTIARLRAAAATTPVPAGIDACALCGEPLRHGGKPAPAMRCDHRFHGACLVKWVKAEGSDRACPTCGTRLALPEPSGVVALRDDPHRG